MSTSKHCGVRFTVPFSQQDTFFECLPFICSDLKYFICEMKNLSLELDVFFVFQEFLSDDLCHKDFDMFTEICRNHHVHISAAH